MGLWYYCDFTSGQTKTFVRWSAVIVLYRYDQNLYIAVATTVVILIFTWVAKTIRLYFGFALLRLVDGLQNSLQFLNQSEVKAKAIVTLSHTDAFSRPSCLLHVFHSSFWLVHCVVRALLWLAIMITLILRHSIENFSDPDNSLLFTCFCLFFFF